ncbi:MAG: hypothetical protein ACYTF2_10945 [Planctomycetota bacterium]|jgi:hypothetical protein
MDRRSLMHQVVVSAAVAGLALAARGAVIYVDDDNCPGPGSGTEGDPYCSIQTAIDNAVDADEIVVAPGTYYETIDFLGKAIWLRSADGAENTIIDAQGAGSTVTCASGEGADTTLEGFTITGGTGTLVDMPSVPEDVRAGGGMLNLGGSRPTVRNCIFSGNTADSFCQYDPNLIYPCGRGGGMYNGASNPTVIDCVSRSAATRPTTAAAGCATRAAWPRWPTAPSAATARFRAAGCSTRPAARR